MLIKANGTGGSLKKLFFSNVEGIQVTKGEVVRAVVGKGIGEGLIEINIKGVQIEAATDLMLTPGQSLLLRSDGIEDGRLMLRIVNPDEEQFLRVANHLQDMGYRVDERLVVTASKLIEYNLPLTRGNLDFIMNSTRLLGTFSPQNLETAAWALAGGVKVDQEILIAIRNFMTKPEMPQQLLQQVTQILSMSNELLEGASRSKLPSSLSLSFNEGELPAPLPVDFSVDAGKLSGVTLSEGEALGNVLPAGNQRINRINDLLRVILSLISIRGTNEPELIRQDLQRFIGANKEVIKALALIREMLAQSPEIARPVVNEAFRLVQTAEWELLGQAAFNSAERPTISQQSGFYYFAIPVEVNGKDRIMELRIYMDDRGKRRLDELEEVRLAISFSTSNLGMVVFHVTWQKDAGLVIQGAVNNARFKEIIEREFDSLRQRLIEIGYQVQFLGMKVTAEAKRLRPGFENKEVGSRMLGIDVRV